jgi:hypothetical protein
MSGKQLDDKWRECAYPWVSDHLYRMKTLFQLQRSSKLNQYSTRRKYLGFINSVFHSGLGVRICSFGEDWMQRNLFELHMDVPIISSTGMRLRSKKRIPTSLEESQYLTLKRFQN